MTLSIDDCQLTVSSGQYRNALASGSTFTSLNQQTGKLRYGNSSMTSALWFRIADPTLPRYGTDVTTRRYRVTVLT
jgi:hypothetical protein